MFVRRQWQGCHLPDICTVSKLRHHCSGTPWGACRSMAMISLYVRCMHTPQHSPHDTLAGPIHRSASPLRLLAHPEPFRAKPALRHILSVPFATFSAELRGTALAPCCSVRMRTDAGQRHEGTDAPRPRGRLHSLVPSYVALADLDAGQVTCSCLGVRQGPLSQEMRLRPR